MKLLVTGGAGFIGTNFIHLVLTETAHTVVNLDALTYAGHRGNCAAFEGGGRYTFVQGDIADAEGVGKLLTQHDCDAIVNFAAESHVDRSIHDAAAFIRTNIQGTQVLLDAAREHGVGRFLHISTDEVYGDLQMDAPAFTETSPIRPSSPYAASKASADMLVLAAHRTHGQPVIITRCSNNYGPYQHPEKFIPMAIHRALAGKPIPIYGRGVNVRDWIHVHDHAEGILRVLEKGRVGEAYNLGGNCERRNIDVAQAILTLVDAPESLIRFVDDRPGHDLRYAIDFTKARDELGWSPQHSFDEGIAETIAWYRENQEWLKQVLGPRFEAYFKAHYGDVQ